MSYNSAFGAVLKLLIIRCLCSVWCFDLLVGASGGKICLEGLKFLLVARMIIKKLLSL